MEILLLAALLAFVFYALNARQQRARIATLGGHLGRFQIERLMEELTQGYMRCLDEPDAARRAQIWSLLHGSEVALAGQFERFAAGFAAVDAAAARVCKLPFFLPLALPLAERLLPPSRAFFFDARAALAIHARGIADAAANVRQQGASQKAFLLTAELLLMQHTCHWFCRSRNVASARLLARHKTSHALALQSVSPETRDAYRALTGL